MAQKKQIDYLNPMYDALNGGDDFLNLYKLGQPQKEDTNYIEGQSIDPLKVQAEGDPKSAEFKTPGARTVAMGHQKAILLNNDLADQVREELPGLKANMDQAQGRLQSQVDKFNEPLAEYKPSSDYDAQISKLQGQADAVPEISSNDQLIASAIANILPAILGARSGEAGKLAAPGARQNAVAMTDKFINDSRNNSKNIKEQLSLRMAALSKLKEQDVNLFDKKQQAAFNQGKVVLDALEKSASPPRELYEKAQKTLDDLHQSIIGDVRNAPEKAAQVQLAEDKAAVSADQFDRKLSQDDAHFKMKEAGENSRSNGKNAKTSEGERRAAGQLGMVRQANAQLQKLGGPDGSKLPSLSDPLFDYKQSVLAGDAIGSSLTENMIKDPKVRSQLQAETDWAQTTLRDESGAAISRSEAIKQLNRYFPRKGDGPDQVAQKAAARLQRERALETQAGRAEVPPIVGVGPAAPISLTPNNVLTPEQKSQMIKEIQEARKKNGSK